MVTLITSYQKLCDELKSRTRTFNLAWWRIGEILREIKDGKLYVEEKITWDAFCARYLDFTKRHADSLIKDATTHAILDDIYREMGRVLPTMSAQAIHETSAMPPKKAAKLIEKVAKTGSVTAQKIRLAKTKLIDAEAIRRPPPDPIFDDEPATEQLPPTRLIDSPTGGPYSSQTMVIEADGASRVTDRATSVPELAEQLPPAAKVCPACGREMP